MNTQYTDYHCWVKIANTLGWVHIHDDFIVVDDADTGECLGEFDSSNNTGWLIAQ